MYSWIQDSDIVEDNYQVEWRYVYTHITIIVKEFVVKVITCIQLMVIMYSISIAIEVNKIAMRICHLQLTIS